MVETSRNSKNARVAWEKRKGVMINPANKYMLKLGNISNIKTCEIYSIKTCEICSVLRTKTSKRHL